MAEKNITRPESEKNTCPADSDNYIKNDKYVKKLKLQRIVLNKLIGTEINMPSQSTNIDPENPNPN
jgi:hypothetical protein